MADSLPHRDKTCLRNVTLTKPSSSLPQVDVTMVKGLTGPNDLEVPIDDSIFDFQVRLSGTVTEAVLKDITGEPTLPPMSLVRRVRTP